MGFGQLHPFAVHFAVALLLIAPACDAVGLVLRRESLLYAGRWNTILGACAAVAGVVSGFGAANGLEAHGLAGGALLQLHRALGLLAAAVWVPVAAWRIASPVALPLRLRTLYLTAAFVGGAMMLVQAGLGTTLVYRHGVGLSASARASAPPPAPAHNAAGRPLD